MPSYATDIEPIISNYCLTCHAPTGEAGDHPLQTYQNVFTLRGSVLDQVNLCKMPQAGYEQPTTDERVALLTWLVCGAPNN